VSEQDTSFRGTMPIEREPVLRYSFQERIMHWFAGLAFVYLLLSGLALFTPHLYWITSVLGGGPTIRYWHPWIGLVFVFAMIWMHAVWRSDMRTTDADRAWNREVKKYIENRDDDVPPAGRFNSGQKQFYWVMIFGLILLLLSGVVMWIPEYIPWSLRTLRPIAVIIHEIAALITIGAFIIHVYMGVFLVPGSLRAIVRGSVSRGWARAHHQLWYDRIAGPSAPKK
jgi:formate dehydrogenase subunit gamma